MSSPYQADAPEPVTKQRTWKVVATFTVEETPDPAYDVQACDEMLDELHTTIEASLQPDLDNFVIDTLQVVDD